MSDGIIVVSRIVGDDMTYNLKDRRPVVITGLIYTIVALITLITSWTAGLHRFDLGITISEYIGLRSWTVAMYLISAAVMVILIFIFIRGSQIPKLRKILYSVIFACVFGCALFPCNYERSHFTTRIHNYFAIGLMLAVTISFVLILIKGRTRRQKIFGLISVCYAALFICCYIVIDLRAFSDTILIWENMFIYLLLIGIFLE